MFRRPLVLLLAIAALGMSGAATASAATPPQARSTRLHHGVRTHRRHRHHIRVRLVTRAGVHHDPVAVTALGLHHIGDPIAFAATAR